MKEIIYLWLVSALFLVGFISCLIVYFIRKNNVYIKISFVFLVILVLIGGYSGYKFASKSYNKIAATFKPRTGLEIYIALFGKPEYNCLNVVHWQDQTVPKIDYAIWLEFQTCPEELERIVSIHKFDRKTISSKDISKKQPAHNVNWFSPQTLGDSVIVYEYKKDDYGNGQTIYTNLEQTKVYCIDVQD